MGSNLQLFRTNLGVVVRPNRFRVELYPPNSLSINNSQLSFAVKSATIPQKTIGEAEMKWFGYNYKLPGDSSVEDLNITFINEQTWNFRSFFEDWQNYLKSLKDGVKADPKDALNSSIKVYQLGLKNQVLAIYEFSEVWVKTVGEIELDMETRDTIETFVVTFTYSRWNRLR